MRAPAPQGSIVTSLHRDGRGLRLRGSFEDLWAAMSKDSATTSMRTRPATSFPMKGAAHKRRLLLYHELPPWQQENEYLLSGYRATAASTRECLESCLCWHNETVNIWSHLLGSLLFAALPWHFYHFVYTQVPGTLPIDLLLVTLYFLGVAVCFVCSASCHIVWNHSPAVAAFGNQLDYLGIVLLMWGASLPSVYYGFICDPLLRYSHWYLMSLLALGCIVATMNPRFGLPRFRTYRACMYTSFGSAALLFVAHGLSLHGIQVQQRRMALDWMLIMAALNVFGAGTYAVRFPERWFPHSFDLVGASHQIFHVMVIFAGIAHYVGLIQGLVEVRRLGHACSI